jgi:hypothetical protein
VDTRDANHGGPEVLEVGRDPTPPRRAFVVAVGVLCFGLGAALGASLLREEVPEPAAGRVLLSVGAVTENPDLFGSARYLVPVHNLGSRTVTVEKVAVEGWSPDGSPVERIDIPTNGWQTVPFAARPLCDTVGPDPRLVVVRGTLDGRAFQYEIPAYASLDVLMRDQVVRCVAPDGQAPRSAQLRGTWIVRDGEYLPGTILVRFSGDGRLLLEDTSKLSVHDSQRVAGRWTLTDSRIAVVADTGSHCSLGDRWEWTATLTRTGWLHLRLTGGGGSGCRRDLDRTWVAERIAP